MPIAATYKGVGIHAGQAARRIALVKREIDKIHNLRLDAVVRDRRRLCLELTPVPQTSPGHPGGHSGKTYAITNKGRPAVNNSPATMHGIDFRSIRPILRGVRTPLAVGS